MESDMASDVKTDVASDMGRCDRVYKRIVLQQTVTVDRIVSLFYAEFSSKYVFHGESHNFWEFIYVDKGEVEVSGDSRTFLLTQGMVAFHKPNEFHSFHTVRGIAPNVLVMSFDCDSEAMIGLEDYVAPLHDEERNLLAQMIKEGMGAFHLPFTIPPVPREDQILGSEQMVKLHLETFLISLLRSAHDNNARRGLSPAPKEKLVNETVREIVKYMAGNLQGKLSLEAMSRDLHVSRTSLITVFKQKTGYSPMEYFNRLKIDKAKEYLREEPLSMTEIASALGYSSVHYFSKSFKKMTGMSPSEYAKSIKARSRV